MKPKVSFEKLDELATKVSDNQAAEILNAERQKLFNLIFVASGGSNNPLLYTDPAGLATTRDCEFFGGCGPSQNFTSYGTGTAVSDDYGSSVDGIIGTVGIAATTTAIFFPATAPVTGPIAIGADIYTISNSFSNNQILEGTHQANTSVIGIKNPT